jgi:microcystin degradation protein MlrC
LKESRMFRILVAECRQEVSSFNPKPTTYDDYTIVRGGELLFGDLEVESSINGARKVFGERSDVELVPLMGACANSAGPFLQADFERLAAEFVDAMGAAKGEVDGFYFSLHGAMAATEELDPEGHLLQQSRRILGSEIPLVISLDMHGVLTQRMLENCDALTVFHTYPHVDFTDTGMRAARLLLQILDGEVNPVIARVTVPALVRGDELITATGVFGRSIRRAQLLEASHGALAAAMMIGNPFTDVPELCSQAVVVTDGDAEAAERAAVEMAEEFWPERGKMQALLVDLPAAIDKAQGVDGTVIFADAADATSSGASGDSNAVLSALVKKGYAGRVLAPLVDAPAVEQAISTGVGGTARFSLGGSVDSRYPPLELEASVKMLATGPYHFESWRSMEDGGNTALLQVGRMTIVVTTKAVNLFDRSLFLAHGCDPRNFDLVVVKSPHCQEHFFKAWAGAYFNVNAPGSASADLKSLGHRICRRPMFPLDKKVEFEPVAQLFSRSVG